MKNIIISFGMIFLFILFLISGCFDSYIEGNGAIQYNDFEGGFYAIVGDDGEKYDPINLPIDFEIDEICIKYILNILENDPSIHRWEVVDEIIEIEKL